MYTPATAVVGTCQLAETPHVPQSYRSVATSRRHGGCVCGSVAVTGTVATLRAPLPW